MAWGYLNANISQANLNKVLQLCSQLAAGKLCRYREKGMKRRDEGLGGGGLCALGEREKFWSGDRMGQGKQKSLGVLSSHFK